MAFANNRGTRDKPRWYIRFKDLDEKWKWIPAHTQTKAATVLFAAKVEERIAKGLPAIENITEKPTVSDLAEKWYASLTNRNRKDDEARFKKYVEPRFSTCRVDGGITIPMVLEWIDELRKTKLSLSTQRVNLNLLSRFCSWTIERGHATVNPVRQVPIGRRPHPRAHADRPWLADEKVTRDIIKALPEPINFMFYLANRSGLRLGEAAGLRISDLGFLPDGVIRVRFSYDGPLKEDKHSEGKVKWVPAPVNAEVLLNDWMIKRKNNGAGPEDLAFPNSSGTFFNRMAISRAWRECKPMELELTWYEASRHSFVSRSLSEGASLDEVSAAVGHSSPIVTRRFYDHFVRKEFSSILRKDLDLGGTNNASVIEMKSGRKRKGQ